MKTTVLNNPSEYRWPAATHPLHPSITLSFCHLKSHYLWSFARRKEGRKERGTCRKIPSQLLTPPSCPSLVLLHYHYLRILGVIRTKLDGLAGDGRTIFHSLWGGRWPWVGLPGVRLILKIYTPFGNLSFFQTPNWTQHLTILVMKAPISVNITNLASLGTLLVGTREGLCGRSFARSAGRNNY